MTDHVERFAPTSGRVSGVIGLLVAVGVLALPLVLDDSGIAPWGMTLAGFVGAVSWAALLRPSMAIRGDALEMRNMFDTIRLPLRMIDEVAVRQVTAILVGEKRYTCAAVGRSRGAIRRDASKPPPAGGERPGDGIGRLSFGVMGLGSAMTQPATGGGRGPQAMSYGFYVQEQIKRAVDDARRVPASDPGHVERRRAWPEIVSVAGTAVATIVLLLV